MQSVKVGLVGCGHWGPNYIRVIEQLPQAEMVICSDLNPEQLARMKKTYPRLQTSLEAEDVLQHPELDAVIIATPASTHAPLVRQALSQGKHVLCEKPLTPGYAESQELVGLAHDADKLLMVGHTFLFNSGILKLKEYIQNGSLGDLLYAHSTRTNLGPIRNDVGAVEDLATHDISIFNYLFDEVPVEVSAKGQSFLQAGLTDVAFINLSYPGKLLAHIHVSWLSPVKVRQITLVGSKKMVVWDDINVVEPIRIYDAGVNPEPYYQDFGQYQLLPKQGDTWIPRLSLSEPLKAEVQVFIQAILADNKQIPSDGHFSAQIVKVLDAIRLSQAQGGQPVPLASV